MPPAASGSVKTDLEALVALYNATDGDNWNASASANWLSDDPLSEWSRVLTDNDGRVGALILLGSGLSGEIPPELGSLSNLQGLYLSDNELSGEIPAWLGNLSNLIELDLSGNALSGEIPPELGSLSNLTELHLDENQLSGEIPPELGNLSSLTYLNLKNNDLSGCLPMSLEDQVNPDLVYGFSFC